MFPRTHGESIPIPVDNAALPVGFGEEITDDLIQSQAFIRNDQPYAFESTFFQVTQEVAPGFFVFTAAFKKKYLGCVVNRFVLYYANVKKGCRENGECIRTT